MIKRLKRISKLDFESTIKFSFKEPRKDFTDYQKLFPNVENKKLKEKYYSLVTTSDQEYFSMLQSKALELEDKKFKLTQEKQEREDKWVNTIDPRGTRTTVIGSRLHQHRSVFYVSDRYQSCDTG